MGDSAKRGLEIFTYNDASFVCGEVAPFNKFVKPPFVVSVRHSEHKFFSVYPLHYVFCLVYM